MTAATLLATPLLDAAAELRRRTEAGDILTDACWSAHLSTGLQLHALLGVLAVHDEERTGGLLADVDDAADALARHEAWPLDHSVCCDLECDCVLPSDRHRSGQGGSSERCGVCDERPVEALDVALRALRGRLEDECGTAAVALALAGAA